MYANHREDVVGLFRPGGPTEKAAKWGGWRAIQAIALHRGGLGQVAFGLSCGGRTVRHCSHQMGNVKGGVVDVTCRALPTHSLSTLNTWGFLVNKLNPERSRFEVGFQWRVFQEEEAPTEIALQPSACLELQ